MPVRDDLPEKPRHIIVPLLTCSLVYLQCAKHLRNMLVRVHLVKLVPLLLQRIDQLLIVKQLRTVNEFFPACQHIQLCHDHIHRPEFTGDIHAPHPGPLLICKLRKPSPHPQSQSLGYCKRFFCPCICITIQQPREDLMQRIIRRPDRRILHVFLQLVKLVREIPA